MSDSKLKIILAVLVAVLLGLIGALIYLWVAGGDNTASAPKKSATATASASATPTEPPAGGEDKEAIRYYDLNTLPWVVPMEDTYAYPDDPGVVVADELKELDVCQIYAEEMDQPDICEPGEERIVTGYAEPIDETDKTQGYWLVARFDEKDEEAYQGLGEPLYADFDQDGYLDVVVPVTQTNLAGDGVNVAFAFWRWDPATETPVQLEGTVVRMLEPSEEFMILTETTASDFILKVMGSLEASGETSDTEFTYSYENEMMKLKAESPIK